MTSETSPFVILLAEDSLADTELVREALMEHHVPCSLRVISDRAQAIAFINTIDTDSKGPPLDLLLLDLPLPKCDGKEVLTRLPTHQALCGNTGHRHDRPNSPFFEGKGDQYPLIVYFRKPSTLDEFMELGPIVDAILEQRAANPGEQTTHGGEA